MASATPTATDDRPLRTVLVVSVASLVVASVVHVQPRSIFGRNFANLRLSMLRHRRKLNLFEQTAATPAFAAAQFVKIGSLLAAAITQASPDAPTAFVSSKPLQSHQPAVSLARDVFLSRFLSLLHNTTATLRIARSQLTRCRDFSAATIAPAQPQALAFVGSMKRLNHQAAESLTRDILDSRLLIARIDVSHERVLSDEGCFMVRALAAVATLPMSVFYYDSPNGNGWVAGISEFSQLSSALSLAA
jgi:hypothetical protein